MPLYAVHALDRPGATALRARLRDAHRARLRAPAPHAVRVVLGGPLLDPTHGQMIGTLLIIEAESQIAVTDFIRGDPYWRADLFASVHVHPWQLGLGKIETQ